MYLSKFYLPTFKDAPADAEIISHKLMLRAGMIKQVSSGIYTWLPLGQIIYKKVEQIVREEMNNIGALELDMPCVQPAELWHDSGRFNDYGPELLRFKDRNARDFCIGPTHEEVITDTVKGYVNSYKQLPITFYQIQKKFRDEVRPRFGVMRGREFLMKDAYSFHADMKSLKETYNDMHRAYCNIFERIGLDYRPVEADTGSIGGNASHEFHVLAETGEDFIAFSDASDYASNVELTPCLPPKVANYNEIKSLEKIHTPNCKTINEVCSFLKCKENQSIKTLIVIGSDNELVALCLLGNHQLNEVKAEKISGIKAPLQMASPEQIKAELNCEIGSLGPVNFPGKVIVDSSVAIEQNLICGANTDDYHLLNMNLTRDVVEFEIVDLRKVEEGDYSPNDNGKIVIRKGIEVGHIFQLGNKYSKAMNLLVLDSNGKTFYPEMGCYGIGVTRIVAAAIEQNNDENGIIWPEAISPFTVVICPIAYQKSDQVKQQSQYLYTELKKLGINVAIDDRDIRPGVMFSEMDLIGIPHRLVVGEKSLANQQIEYKSRVDSSSQLVSCDDIISFIVERLK